MIPGQTVGCGVELELSAAEARVLASMLDGTQPVASVVYCELEADHPGSHLALGQVSGPDWWWLRWDEAGQHRELVAAVCCDALAVPGGPGEPGVPCWLPAGHAGAHGFTRPA